MSVSSVTSSPSTGLSASAMANASTTTAARTPTKTLGEQDFLQLLSTQLQNQDPMQPMDDTQFIAQMAQFSSLQQMSLMQSNQQQMNAV
ncbi:MAG: flagellar hook capping FlgD N-terminal domain-containing protein, partial [Opitutales bacterium]